MVNPIVPRLLGVGDEPASLKIPGHTTHLTMIIELQSTDGCGCEYSARVKSSVPFQLESDHLFWIPMVVAKKSPSLTAAAPN
jgi:hypothetical protein